MKWSEPRQLNDDPKGARVGQFYPKISVVPGGRIDVAWYDFRHDSFPAPTLSPTATAPFLALTTNIGKFDAVYMTSSEDGGDSWSRNIQVSDVPNDRTIGTAGINFQVQVPLAVGSVSGRTIVAWSDTRYGNPTAPPRTSPPTSSTGMSPLRAAIGPRTLSSACSPAPSLAPA